MNGFAILTSRAKQDPNREVFKSLMKGVARLGWSYSPDLNLRKLERKRSAQPLNKEERDAWNRSHIFLDRVERGDLLFYRHQPERDLVTVVQVTGDYTYHPSAQDFRSRRACDVVKLSVPLQEFPEEIRKRLKIPGRLNEIHDEEALDDCYKRLSGKGGGNSSKPGEQVSHAGGSTPKGGLSYSYLLPEREVVVRQRHENYKKSLDLFLKGRGLKAVYEKDHVDVAFSLNGQQFLGEIKVTNPPNAKDAFRMALGQLFEYRHLYFDGFAGPVMFLDAKLDEQRLALATQLGVAVVRGRKGDFILLNPTANPELKALFSPAV